MIDILRRLSINSLFRHHKEAVRAREMAKSDLEITPLAKDIYDVLIEPMPRSSIGIVHEFQDGSQKIYDPIRLAAAEEIKRLRTLLSEKERAKPVATEG